MRIGYCCINETLKAQGLSFKTMTVKHFNKNELLQRIRNNFYVTYRIMEWNAQNNIHLYRFSSDLVPLATHELNDIEWWKDVEVLKYCKLIRNISKEYDIQTSFHPSQFTLLTSPDDKVIQNSYKDLQYHYKMCKLLDCKLILLHIGGIYGDKEKAIKRFYFVFHKLPQQLKDMLYFENDDKSYNLEEVLKICETIKRPIVSDYHHDRVLPSSQPFSYYLDRILNTWQYSFLEPKVHLSSSKETDKIVRNHAEYVLQEDYNQCVKDTMGKVNIMLECKAKELAIFNLRL